MLQYLHRKMGRREKRIENKKEIQNQKNYILITNIGVNKYISC